MSSIVMCAHYAHALPIIVVAVGVFAFHVEDTMDSPAVVENQNLECRELHVKCYWCLDRNWIE
jgi:hypothetical protein